MGGMRKSGMGLKGAAISAMAWKLLERGGYQLVQLVVQIVMARLLAPEEFGALAIILVFVNVGNVFVQAGLPTALVRTPELLGKDASTVFWLCLAVSLVLYCMLYPLAPPIADFYGIPGLVWPLRAIVLLLPMGAYYSVQCALVQRALQYRKVFNATLWSVGVSSVVGLGIAFAGGGLWALVAQQLSFQLVSCISLGIQLDWRLRAEFDSNRAKELFSFGWKLLVSGLLDKGYQSLSDLIIGKQFSAASLGLVSQGKKYPAAVGTLLDGAIQPVMLSAVAHVQSDVAQVKRLVRRALKTSTFLIVPSMTLFAVCAEPVVRILLGEQWLPAVPFLQMYCVVYMLLPIHTTNLQALNGMGRSDLFLKLELIKKAYGLVNLLVMAFVFKDVYLMVGSYILTGVVSTFVNAWPNKRVIGYSYLEQVRDICPAFLLSAAAGALAWAVGLAGLPDIAAIPLQALVMAAAYLALARLFRVEELGYLIKTAKEMLASRRG